MKRIHYCIIISIIILLIIFNYINASKQKTENSSLSNIKHEKPSLDNWAELSKKLNIIPNRSEQTIERIKSEWKESFPFPEKYHSHIKHDTNIYDPNNPNTWNDDTIKKAIQREMVINHGFMKNFYASEVPYSKSFKDLYEYLKRYERHTNPIVLGWIYNDLVNYNESIKHLPEELYTKTKPALTPPFEPQDTEYTVEIPVDGKTTWGDRMEKIRESIATNLYNAYGWPDNQNIKAEDSWKIADELILNFANNEELRNLNGKKPFAYHTGYEEELKNGDSLLIPYEGYIESYEVELSRNKDVLKNDIRRKTNNILENYPNKIIKDENGNFYDAATGEPFMPGVTPIELTPNNKKQN